MVITRQFLFPFPSNPSLEQTTKTQKKGVKRPKNLLLSINLKPSPEIFALILDVLIHARGTEAVLHALVPRPHLPRMLVPVLDLQMNGLVFLMVRPRAAHGGQDIEADLAVVLLIRDLRFLVRAHGRFVVFALVFQRPGRPTAEEVRFEAGVEDPAVEAEGRVEGGPHVADFFQFFPDGTFPQRVLVVVEEDGVSGVFISGEGVPCGFGGEHAASHGGVGAFDFGHVEEAGGVAYKGASRKRALGDGLEAAFVESAGAVGDAFAALNDGFVEGVVLKFLELTVGGEPWVGIIQANYQTEGD